MDHVRGIDDDHGFFSGEQVTEGLPVEDMLVVVIRRQVAAIIVRGKELGPVDRVEERGTGEVTLDVLLQEAGLEILEDSVPKQAVVGRREAPAGNAGDPVHLVQQAPAAAADGDRRIAKRFQDPVGKGGGSGPPAGKTEHEQQLVVVIRGDEVSAPITRLRVPLRKGWLTG